MNIIETKNLSKYYGSFGALVDFSVNVEKGTIFSLLGANGAGKTTLMKVLLSIVKPSRGSASLFGISIKNPESRLKVGFLSEKHSFPAYLNAKQLLYYYGKMSRVPNDVLEKRIPELLELVNLAEKAKLKIRKYSKGMLQRLGIAQALINDPDLLFLDEPTDGIDPIGRKQIREILLLLKNKGKTVFINSHLLSEVERISDRIAILKDGHLIKLGSLDDFVSVKNHYELDLSGDEETIKNCFISSSSELVKFENKNYTIKADDTTHLNKVIDNLRENSILIESLKPKKISLEDFFIKVIE